MSARYILSTLLAAFSACCWADFPTVEQARSDFQNPTRHYSNGPLWVWNDMLTEAQIRDTLQDLARQHVKQVWVHPRPGLMTPYLSNDWFRLLKVALRQAEKLDMNVWIYDENSYPSGFAGGFVPEAMPESRGRGLAFRESKTAPAWDTNIVCVYQQDNERFENVTERVKEGKKMPEGAYLTAHLQWADKRAWHGDRFYVNLLSPGVTKKFMEVTYGPYERELGQHFGKRIPGIFTDEPNIRPVGGTLPWSEVLAAEFEKRWGYDLLEHLPSLTRQTGDWRKVRHNYFQVLHEQFVEHWAKPNFEYCAKKNLEWTGHYWDHDWPECVGVPDNMAMYAWHQRPAIDCLMNQYREATDAQFGNVRMVRELSSVANQLGIKRTLCETYGAAGWDLRFEDMKRIGDWLQVLGVNTINEHLSFVTIRGARKRDHPQSFSYHEPWWEGYHVIAGYFARLSAALSQGEQINPVLVLEPTTTAWMYQGEHARLTELGKSFNDLLVSLEAAQVEYDLVSEDILERFGKPGSQTRHTNEGEKPYGLRIGQREYTTVVIPPFTENLNRRTQELLGGCGLMPSGSMPSRVDGALAGQEQSFHWIRTNLSTWTKLRVQSLQERQRDSSTVFVDRAPGDRGILFHMRRKLNNGELLFLANTSVQHPSHSVVLSKLPGIEQWDLNTGETKPYPCVLQGSGLTARVELPPSGSLLLMLNDKAAKRQFPAEIAHSIAPTGFPSIQRQDANVLTLDYLDVTAGGETLTNSYFARAGDFIWKKNGMDKNPWDSAVQFKDELIRRTFPAGSGFEATYKFRIQDSVPAKLEVVIERADLYQITLNGTRLKPSSKWWLDKSFNRINVAKLARTGDNSLTIKASPMTMFHELEPAYVIGDFGLEAVESGFVITPEKPLKLGQIAARETHSVNPDGTMWLSAGVGFRRGTEDRAPWILFDLGRTAEFAAVKIWNYNESHVRDLTARGARKIRLLAGNSTDALNTELGEFELARGNNRGLAQEIQARGKARFVKVEFLSNHYGAAYPLEGTPDGNENDFAMVGLAEVQFINSKTRPIVATIASCSSELPSHARMAKHLVDGSGISTGSEGWNFQGMPFYAGRVGYKQVHEISKPSGRYVVALPSWNGSVAQVKINGKPSGWITAPPYECDVTRQIKSGANEVEVVVIGTLKNTLGPHHNNPGLGSAWPSRFKVAPDQGPPHGAQYSTVGYGLFEPMQLRNLVLQERVAAAE